MRLPNIVWIVADQQPNANRPAVAGAFATQSRLAARGMRFTRAYTVLPICTPARASMLTGLYPHRHGITENDGRFGGRAGVDQSDWLMHRPLVEAGYRCGWFGKWHLDNEHSASAYGFEGVSLPGYGYPYGTEEYRAYLGRSGLAPPVATVEIPGESGIAAGTRVDLAEAADWFDYEAGTAVLDGPAEAHEAFFIAALARDWIAEAAEGPFFLRVDPWGPHPPYVTAAPFAEMFAGMSGGQDLDLPGNFTADLATRPGHHRDYRDYWTATLGLDLDAWQLMARRSLQQAALVEAALAGVLDALEAAGVAENTLVLFCADHGDAVASNGGVANKGGLMVEETLRIPLAIAGPGVAAGAVCDRLVGNIDLAPTILAACGIEPGVAMDGVDLGPLLRDPDAEGRDGLMTQHFGLHVPVMQRAYHAGDWKLVMQEDGFAELYDLARDPCELVNLAGDRGHAVRLEEMRTGLSKTMQATGDIGLRRERILAFG